MNYLNNKRYTCEVCGRQSTKKFTIDGKVVCEKHYTQFRKHKRFLDNIQRNSHDLNDYEIVGDIVYFNVYKQDNTLAEKFIIDLVDLEKVKYKKWRMCHRHVVTGQPVNKAQRDVAHVILGVEPNGVGAVVVDHIDGNTLNNRRSNIRIVTQGENTQNRRQAVNNKTGYTGVSFVKWFQKFIPEISKGHIKACVGRYKTLAEAVYARYLAEELVFGKMCNAVEHAKKEKIIEILSEEQKSKIKKYVYKVLNRKNLIEI